MKKMFCAMFVGMLCTAAATAAVPDGLGFSSRWTPFELDIFWPVQLFTTNTQVNGLDINLPFGVQDRINGVNLGGVQITGDLNGVGINCLYNGVGALRGLIIAPLNVVVHNYGLAFGGVNVSDLDNLGEEFGGMQMGAVNYAQSGLQIGVVNYNANSAVPWTMFFNYSVPVKPATLRPRR